MVITGTGFCMTILKCACVAIIALAAAGAGAARAAGPAHDPLELARVVEARAGASSFGELDAFGRAAMSMRGAEGLNRLYHVTWITLNQGEFDRAAVWNGRLKAAARAQGDLRYMMIAALNDLTIRYDSGDTSAAVDMERIRTTTNDWFVRAHASRLSALALMDEGRIGDGLKLVSDADAAIPEDAPFADTARAGLWEVAGIGLMKLNDIAGATTAFGRFEIDYSRPDYPRPDFDALYNLARLAVQVGDQPLADQLYASHHRLARHANLESLSVYDANLCAMVAQARRAPRDVLACLEGYGADLGAADFLAPQLLPARAIAYAETGHVALARRDLAEIRRRSAAGTFREEGSSEIPHVEAALLFAEGRTEEAYRLMRDHARTDKIEAARQFSAGIRQVTGDMQEQLALRRRQLDTARANTNLQRDVIQSQRWIVGIAVAFFVTAAALLIWQWRLAGHLRVARRRAEDANRSKSEFLANMSHEIRTPLNGVVAMADALSRSDLGSREHEMLQIIRSSSVTLERLLSDILDSARIESGQVSIEAASFSLNDAVRDTVYLWGPKAADRGVALVARLDPGLPAVVLGDVVRVRQVLGNLVSNAIKFTADGEVAVSVELAENDHIRFTVADSGVGFDAEQKARIFGRFHQADGSITRRFGGTGLGLAISRDLAGLMGGRLDCESTPGAGSTFWFEIPLPASDQACDVATDAADALGEGPLRILLADDHPANRKVIEVLLSATDAELVSVADGRQAVDAFARGGFDLVLMDMQMPVMDGLSATAAIRVLEVERDWPRTPVLMLTANAMAEHVEAGREAGADGHLAKPVTMATLVDGISTALQPGRRAGMPQAA